MPKRGIAQAHMSNLLPPLGCEAVCLGTQKNIAIVSGFRKENVLNNFAVLPFKYVFGRFS